jgi:hypothetical protein
MASVSNHTPCHPHAQLSPFSVPDTHLQLHLFLTNVFYAHLCMYTCSWACLSAVGPSRCKRSIRHLTSIDCNPVSAISVAAIDEAPSAPISFELPHTEGSAELIRSVKSGRGNTGFSGTAESRNQDSSPAPAAPAEAKSPICPQYSPRSL